MDIFIKIFALIATFWFMEFVAWFTHKYVMHGSLWVLHYDHHNQPKGFYQKNDAFFLIFAVPSSVLMITGSIDGLDVKFWIGLGILFYGFAYFLIHEVLIHKRFKTLRKILFSPPLAYYFRVLEKAHHFHHKHLGKEDGESFGMLIVDKKYYALIKQSEKSGKAAAK